jgi:GntR family transcriptional regulator
MTSQTSEPAEAPPRVNKTRMVSDWLIERIATGEFPQKGRLPSESELARRFGVSRITVRLALQRLRDADLIEGRQGKGYFVRSLCAVQDLGRLQGFGEIMAPLGIETRSEVVEFEQVEASPSVAASLRLERGETVCRLLRVRMAGNVAASLDESFFPLEIGQRLAEEDLQRVDVFALLERRLGIEIGYADIVMEIAEASDEVADRMGFDRKDTLIHIERLTYSVAGLPIDFEHLYARADAHRFKTRVPRW